jgi:rhodanese-related sulfurtransferase
MVAIYPVPDTSPDCHAAIPRPNAPRHSRADHVIAQALRQLAALLALALAPALVSGLVQLKLIDREPLQDEVAANVAQSWGVKVQWVDARPRAKFEQGHIPGAVLLNEDEWDRLVPAFLDAWEPEKVVVVYCEGGSCDASHSVARRLREDLKLENVHVLKGGWAAWPQK